MTDSQTQDAAQTRDSQADAAQSGRPLRTLTLLGNDADAGGCCGGSCAVPSE
jgi:hypothetical protein